METRDGCQLRVTDLESQEMVKAVQLIATRCCNSAEQRLQENLQLHRYPNTALRAARATLAEVYIP